MTVLMQGSSIPEIDMAAAAMKLNDDGSANLHIGATDLGTGSDTVLAQIAAETLKLPLRDIIVFSSDTDHTPFDTGAYASSTTYLTGQAVRRVAERLLAEILSVGSEMLGVPVDQLDAAGKKVFVRSNPERSVDYQAIALRSLYMKNQRQLAATASAISHVSPPPFSAHFAEVEVDMETGLVRCLRYVAGVDCGRPINPQLAQGQAEGAVINALSSAITEEYIFSQNGRMVNPTFNYYKIFAAPDIPDLKVFLVETDEPSGPYGAKSVSEICTNGPLPAISNAIFNATGARVRKSPFSPESVLAAIDAARAQQ